MKTLVIETATAACSVALIDGERVIAQRHEIVGRGHAERLVPMIAELPENGRAACVLVDCGPGSFTGVRVGLAAAIAFGIGWGVPVRGYSSLALLAASEFASAPTLARLAVVIEGGHGEVFMQMFDRDPMIAETALISLPPADALARLDGRRAIGSGVARLLSLAPDLDAADALPRAADILTLAAPSRDLEPRPIYGRGPDAKLPA